MHDHISCKPVSVVPPSCCKGDPHFTRFAVFPWFQTSLLILVFKSSVNIDSLIMFVPSLLVVSVSVKLAKQAPGHRHSMNSRSTTPYRPSGMSGPTKNRKFKELRNATPRTAHRSGRSLSLPNPSCSTWESLVEPWISQNFRVTSPMKSASITLTGKCNNFLHWRSSM